MIEVTVFVIDSRNKLRTRCFGSSILNGFRSELFGITYNDTESPHLKGENFDLFRDYVYFWFKKTTFDSQTVVNQW